MELVELRAENAKTYDLGGNKRQLVAFIGAIHYKDDYASNEAWKDIDLTWVGNRITKAPYELTLEGNKVTIRDKKTGEISTIELQSIGSIPIPAQAWEKSKGLAKAFATNLEIVVENSVVRYARILASDKAPTEAKYKVITKNPLVVRASDEEGELPVEWVLENEILTETLKPDRPVKYPVRIDPTWQVGASTDDCLRQYTDAAFATNYGYFEAGFTSGASQDRGSGARFLNVAIPAGVTITLANLVLTCRTSRSTTTVNTRLRAELNVSPAAFSDATDFDARTWTSAGTHVHWNAIEAWTAETEYTSPDIKACIQEVANLGAITHLVILWDDFEKLTIQSADNTSRNGYSWDISTTKAPKLVITYTTPSKRGWWSK